MREPLVVKQGDKYPTTWTVPMDLSGATVRLLARRRNAEPVVLASAIIDAPNGVVQHVLTGTLPVAEYRVELEITRAGETITAPTDHFENLTVISDLD